MDGIGNISSPTDVDGTGASPARVPTHRKTLSVPDDIFATKLTKAPAEEKGDYSNYCPVPLKARHAQNKMLLLSVPLFEKVVSVFRSVWNANWQQEFPGRVYVRTKEIYAWPPYSIIGCRDCGLLYRTFGRNNAHQ
jgi:hypothetical protein